MGRTGVENGRTWSRSNGIHPVRTVKIAHKLPESLQVPAVSLLIAQIRDTEAPRMPLLRIVERNAEDDTTPQPLQEPPHHALLILQSRQSSLEFDRD